MFKQRFWIVHLLVWVLMFAMQLVNEYAFGQEEYRTYQLSLIGLYGVVRVTLFYVFYLLIAPLINQSKYLLFVVFGLLASYLVPNFFSFNYFTFVRGWLELGPGEWQLAKSFYFMTDGVMIGIIGSLAYLARAGIRRRQEDALLKQEKTDLEMQALKSRLNPHFLFNTLNNIYYLSRQKRDEAPEAVLLLAETMRYMLDASAKETVPLTEEVKAADQILELIKYRVAPSFSVHLTSNIVVNHPIMPTIILTLVENAMKHGDLSDDGFIHIKVQTTDEYILIKSINRVGPEGKSLEVQSGKFGLSSLKRSLELVYPQQHTFESKRVDNQFEVAIELHAV